MRFCWSLLATIGLFAASPWRSGKVVAHIQAAGLTESSGLAASRSHPGVFWSHNDSASGPYLFAFDRTGRSLGRWTVAGARNYDWEDLSVGPGPKKGTSYLYIGDIGDNTYRRKSILVYRIPEPDPASPSRVTAVSEKFRFQYPDGPHDAEALLVHPRSGHLYIVTKARGHDVVTRVFKSSPPVEGKIATLEQVTDLQLPGGSLLSLLMGRVTGGAISPDGRRVLLCDYSSGWEAVLPAGARNFDAVWQATWAQIDLGVRDQGEAVTYGPDGMSVFATSEGTAPSLVEAIRER